LVAPQLAWRELADVEESARLPSAARLPDPARLEFSARLPSPARMGASCAGVASALSAVVYAALPHATPTSFGAIARCTLAAVGGGVGATALAVCLVPRLLRAEPAVRPQLARYASAASLPLTAAGLALSLPGLIASLCAIGLLGLLAYRSGSIGAEVLLGLSKPARIRTAGLTSLVTTLPALFVSLLCATR
jgi:hypothetical protein